jgi:hypothetical protein
MINDTDSRSSTHGMRKIVRRAECFIVVKLWLVAFMLMMMCILMITSVL